MLVINTPYTHREAPIAKLPSRSIHRGVSSIGRRFPCASDLNTSEKWPFYWDPCSQRASPVTQCSADRAFLQFDGKLEFPRTKDQRVSVESPPHRSSTLTHANEPFTSLLPYQLRCRKPPIAPIWTSGTFHASVRRPCGRSTCRRRRTRALARARVRQSLRSRVEDCSTCAP